jgi:hypothetical protein
MKHPPRVVIPFISNRSPLNLNSKVAGEPSGDGWRIILLEKMILQDCLAFEVKMVVVKKNHLLDFALRGQMMLDRSLILRYGLDRLQHSIVPAEVVLLFFASYSWWMVFLVSLPQEGWEEGWIGRVQELKKPFDRVFVEDRMYDRDSGRRSWEWTFELMYSVEEK